ncbi:MAG: glucose-6-phosphate dehydrogenase [Phycisphaerae bacterium]|nr:glucose-6-phosphate dehydrogenase [Phycisphaerae bacterium]
MNAPEPCVLLILGASGDLTQRKLVPALYEMARAGALPSNTCILGVSRTPKTDDVFRSELERSVRAAMRDDFDAAVWKALAERIFYLAGDAVKPDAWREISERIADLNQRFDCRGNTLFYLSVAPELYEPIVANIDAAHLVTEGKQWCSLDRSRRSWQRIVVEKPFGNDLNSARALNRALGRTFEEDAIYRIDHYLGKEVVQNLLVFRFANAIFEPVWNARYVDHVQITASETLGVENRSSFYDQTGAIRDMIQSHLLQVLAFVAMEPPSSYTADQIRAEKRKIIESIQVARAADLPHAAALGQYGAGVEGGAAADAGAAGAAITAYADLPNVAPGTTTETFAALRFTFDNWRWGGTPFYVRTGKRMPRKCTQIVVQFKCPPVNLFRGVARESITPDRMIIEIAPTEHFRVRFNSKVPGPGIRFKPVEMRMDYHEEFRNATIEAYGPLMLDAMRGDQTLFKTREETEDAWRAVMPFLGAGSAPVRANIRGNYAPGTWGPAAADELLARDGRAWHNER